MIDANLNKDFKIEYFRIKKTYMKVYRFASYQLLLLNLMMIISFNKCLCMYPYIRICVDTRNTHTYTKINIHACARVGLVYFCFNQHPYRLEGQIYIISSKCSSLLNVSNCILKNILYQCLIRFCWKEDC